MNKIFRKGQRMWAANRMCYCRTYVMSLPFRYGIGLCLYENGDAGFLFGK